MKKRVFSILLVLALLLAALAGCGQDNGSSSKSGDDDEEQEQLLSKGIYEVYNDVDDLVGYLEVKKSRITSYDSRGNEEETLRYDYDEDEELYTLDGELKLFGSDEFTVKERKGTLTLTADGDKYTLEEIDEDEIGGGGKDVPDAPAETPNGENPDCVELPLGCYAVYEDGSIIEYMKITDSTLTEYSLEGEPFEDVPYNYDRDGNCVLNPYDDYTFEWRFFYEDGDYYLETPMEYLLLEPIRESEIPVYTGSGGTDVPAMDGYYIGDNGSISLYAWLPDELYGVLDSNRDSDLFIGEAMSYDSNTALIFTAILSSGDNLQDAINSAKAAYTGTYTSDADLLFQFFRENLVTNGLSAGYLGGEYLGDDLDYQIYEDERSNNGQNWRLCNILISAEDGEAYVAVCLWMEGDDMALVIIGGIMEGDGAADVYEPVFDIVDSLMVV